jgi:hypothetical protein
VVTHFIVSPNKMQTLNVLQNDGNLKIGIPHGDVGIGWPKIRWLVVSPVDVDLVVGMADVIYVAGVGHGGMVAMLEKGDEGPH